MSLKRLIFIGCGVELCYLSFYTTGSSAAPVLGFIAVNALAYLVLAYLAYRFRSVDESAPSLVAVILGFGLLFRLTVVPLQPIASDDIYRYVWDGKVAAHGINPFALAPTDPSLQHLHTDVLPSKINFPHMRTIYPPLAQGLFFSSNLLFGDFLTGLKCLLILFDLVTVWLLILLLKQFSLNPALVTLYAWSPLPIMYFGLDGHIDALGIPFLLLAILLAARNRHVAAAVSLGFAALAKLYPLFVAPMLLRAVTGVRKLWVPAIPVIMLAAGCWLYLEPTGGLYESFGIFNSTWEFNGSIFSLLYSILHSNEQAHLVSGVLFFLWIGGVALLDRELLEKVFLGFLGFIILAPVVHPWYLSWLAALIVLRWSTAVFVLLGLSNLSNIVVYQYQQTGVWQFQPWIGLLEYIPFYALLVWEIARGKFALPSKRLAMEQ